MILRQLAILLPLCLSFTNTYPQQPKLDSLLKADQAYTKEDTTKLKLLNDIAFFQQYSNPEEGLRYAEVAIALATKLKDEPGLARAYFVMGVDYLRMDQVSKTLEYLQKAARLYEAQNKPIDLARVYNTIGAAYLPHKEHYNDALVYLNKAVTIYNNQSEKQLLPHPVLNMALVYKRMDSVAPALQHFNEALRLFALYAPDNKQLEARIYSGLGDAYIQFSAAALRAAGFTGEKNDTAIYYVQKALSAFNELGSEDGRTGNYRRLATIYLAQKKYALAFDNALMAKQIAQQGGFLAMEADAITVISEINAATGHYDSAYAYLKQYVVLNDSLLNDEKERELIQKEMQYHFDKKEDSLHFQNTLLSTNNALSKLQLRQQWMYSAGALLLLLGLGGFLYYRNHNKQSKLVLQLEKERAEQKQRESEFERKVSDAALHSLRSQMNPHFIFNCLNSINRYIVKSDQATASLYLTRFAKLIRLILDNSNSKTVTLANELEALRLYIEMESIRFEKKFTYTISVDEDVQPDCTYVPPLIIQPYVENAIWHGLLHKETEGHLIIHVSRPSMNLLECVIEDDGIGRVKARELKSKSASTKKSLGMKLTEDRLALLNKQMQMDSSVEVEDMMSAVGDASGTRVIVRIPIDA